ncbi:MAG: alpha/beta fold hydrolase [Actinomycetota bacterium]
MSKNLTSKKSIFSRKRFWLIGVYVLLLIWSGVFRHSQPEKPVSNDKKIAFLQTIDGENTKPEKIRFAYKETLPEPPNDSLPVILIHGSPGDGEAFDALTKLLKNRRIIAVDLPGFGDSEKNIPDYSVLAHARYVLELLDNLNIEKAHVVGFSMGGGVVLNLAELAPNRVASVSMVSAIGVQEDELFGNYYLNHAVHAAQLAALYALPELTPHFGVFDGSTSYARNFYDTDQRPLRPILQKIDAPFLITHGLEDPLVPIEAAREHARLVPQSELVELADNHFYVFMRPEKISPILTDFWQKAENGTAKTRATADAERIAESQKPFAPKIIRARGATVFLFFLLFVILTFLSEDFAFLLAGIFAAQDWFSFTFAVIVCLFGAFAAVFLIILLGRFFGQRILQSFPFRQFISKSSIEKKFAWLKSNRWQAIFLRRNFFGFRFSAYFAAGMLHARFWCFCFGFFASALLWAFGLIGFSFFLAKGLIAASLINQQNFWAISALIFVLYILLKTALFLRQRRKDAKTQKNFILPTKHTKYIKK